jgi:predicted AlkP superfamily pyrophosphatase or phosphodiesterase
MKHALFFLLLCLPFVTPLEAKPKQPKPKAQHVLVIGIDGWGGYSLAKAHDIPNIRMLMQQGCYTAKKRSVLPSDSGVNWASMFNGSCPELHGYTTWNSHTPEIPSVELNEHGKFPTIFSILRKARPDVVTGCIAEWDGIKHVVDTMAIDYYDLAPDWEHHTSLLCEMAERFIIDRKPTLFAVCWDQLDHTGHSIGHDTPEYYQTLAELDVFVGRLIQALKTAGIYDQTIIIITADHGGVNKGHGGKSLLEMEHPFIICGRGIRSGLVIEEPMMQFDTAATIAYIFGLTPPRSWVGRPVLSVFTK